MGKSIYRKLTGRKGRFIGYSQLWLAPDHLLLVTSTRITEHYQRFALADIQSITITEAPDRIPFQIAGALAAVAWGFGYLAFHSPLAKYFFAVTGALALAGVIADIVRGPGCRCHLTTAVSRELLRPVSRMRTARSFMEIVQPAIEAVQGSLNPAEPVPVSQPAVSPDAPPAVPAKRGLLPEAVFILFLVDAALILLAMRFPRSQMDAVLPTTFFAEIVLVTVALIQRGGRDPRRAIYVLMMLAMIGIGWDGIEIGRNVVGMIGVAIATGRQDKALEVFNHSFWSHGAVRAALWRIAAGVIGLGVSLFGRVSE